MSSVGTYDCISEFALKLHFIAIVFIFTPL